MQSQYSHQELQMMEKMIMDKHANDVTVTLTVGDASKAVQFTNSYYQSSDYDLTSGFYNENGTERLTTHINNEGAVVQLNSSTSKGSTITYRTDFNYQKIKILLQKKDFS